LLPVADFYAGYAFFLLLTVALGLVRVLRGPTSGDRMLAAQLFGTSGVAILVLLGLAMDEPALWDIALVFALLAAVAGVAFVQRIWGREQKEEENGDQ
jgi:multicomponent Na+:H+ antiporter subunit F